MSRHNTRTVTCNKSNWSGESVTVEVTVHADTSETFSLYGYDFTVEPIKIKWADDPKGLDCKARSVTWSGNDGEFLKLIQFPDENWMSFKYGVQRDHEDPIIVAIQMICNLV